MKDFGAPLPYLEAFVVGNNTSEELIVFIVYLFL
jgi:hypothetical protein